MSLKDLLASKDVAAIKAFFVEHKLKIVDGRIVPIDAVAKAALLERAEFWNQRQQARKILLNSLYGALLNAALRFYDERLGQSVTLTGRSIVRHMNAKINEIITGTYDHKGVSVTYADTDSCYFSAYPTLEARGDIDNWTRESFVTLYDEIADTVNASFPDFMQTTFHTTAARGGIIGAGRELVAARALFIKKKKYAALMYDKEGTRLDRDGKPGKLKVMGLDLKRADTPKYMQEFLERLLMGLLSGAPQQQLYDAIKSFRRDFKERPGWEKGSPKKVAGMNEYAARDRATQADDELTPVAAGAATKVNMPGHVRASLNWNRLCALHRDLYVARITDGTRIIVCKLRRNTLGMDSVAYPIDEPHLPAWFRALPFDDAAMEETIIDKKILNLVGVLRWDLTATKEKAGDEFFQFG